jgi:hypothetical protein
MRLTNLLAFLPVAFAAPIPTSTVLFELPGTALAPSAPTSTPYPSFGGPIAGGDRAIGGEAVAKFQQAFLQIGITDIPSTIEQAIKTKNIAVEKAATTAGINLATASQALAKIFNDIGDNKKPNLSDQATAAKRITAAQEGVDGLAKLIANEDVNLSKFIAAAVDDMDVIRKGMETVLAFSDLTFDSVGKQQDDKKDPANENPQDTSQLFQQGRDKITEGLGKVQTDLDAVFSQAGKSKNLEVQTGTFAAQDSLGVASLAIFNMLNSTGYNTEPSRNDMAKAVKGIATAEKIVGGLEKVIVNEDADLCKLITTLVTDVALIRKGAEEILSVSDLTFDTIGKPKGEKAAVGDTALEKSSESSITDLKSSLKDFAAVVAQAEDSKNDDVSTGARDLRTSLQSTLTAAQTIADAVKTKSGLSRNDQAILAKGITTAKDLADKLEGAITNKDEILSDFITSGLNNLGLARKDIDDILAFNNLTVEDIGEPTEESPVPTSTIEFGPAVVTPSPAVWIASQ